MKSGQYLFVVILVGLSSPVIAQEKNASPAALDEVVVSASPLPKTIFESAQSISVLDEDDLARDGKPSLGETLSSQPGISSTAFGQAASRPIIRGLGGDRIRILQGGTGIQDVSNISPDHAPSLEPVQSTGIEVVRGPATLMYGPNAIGGVVNVLDDRIAETLSEKASGELDLKGATVDWLRSSGAKLNAPVGPFQLHIDGFYRKSDSYDIPGFARSKDARRSGPSEFPEEPKYKLPQSFAEADGASLGASYIFEDGYFGVAGNLFDTVYGIPSGETDVRISMHQRRMDIRGRIDNPLPFLQRAETKTGIVHYEHTEYEGAEPGTVFSNEGIDTRIDLSHQPIGPVQGALGIQFNYSDFAAIGEEAVQPPTRTNIISGFVFEELPASDSTTFQAGGRIDGNEIRTISYLPRESDLSLEASPSFTTLSGAFGVVQKFLTNYAATLSLTHTERAPSGSELFSNGPHVATNAFEIGDPDLGKESANGIDLNLRKRSGWVTGFVSGYYNRFNSFISENPTGEEEDDFPVYVFRGVDADFFGAEAQAVIHLFGPGEDEDETTETRKIAKMEGTPNGAKNEKNYLNFITQVDFVRAYGRDGSGDLPRIPPWRLLLATEYQRESFGARLEVQQVFNQDSVADFETDTSAYTLVNAVFSKDFELDSYPVSGFLRFDNIFNEEARVHTSFIKDFAPLPGTNMMLGFRFRF